MWQHVSEEERKEGKEGGGGREVPICLSLIPVLMPPVNSGANDITFDSLSVSSCIASFGSLTSYDNLLITVTLQSA